MSWSMNSCLLAIALAASTTLPGTAALAKDDVVLPEQQKTVVLSNVDLNRIVCEAGDIEDVKYSADHKPVIVEVVGEEAYIKFNILETPTETKYVKIRSEFFFRCGGVTYSILGKPEKVPSRSILLAAGSMHQARENVDLLGPLVEEERAVSITVAMLKDTIPGSFKVNYHPITWLPGPTAQIDVAERRYVEIAGFDMAAAEFLIAAKQTTTLDERLFLDPRFGANIYAVTVERQQLNAGEQTRVVLIYRGASE